jgi:CO/xanthine dehydrogenase FAD-binding subunit
MITQYLLPGSAEEAAAELRDAVVMAGGTTVMPAVHAGALDATRVVGLARAGLAGMTSSGIGAMTPLAALDGPLAEPARAVGGPALRNMATIGGNLVVGGDVAVALLALDAQVRLSSRTLPVADFWSSFEPGSEIVLSVSFGDADLVFLRCARRAANSPAVVSVAVSGRRVALGGVASHPVRSPGAEASFDDPAAAGAAAAAEIDPPTDAIASAWYRRRMTELFVRRALEAAHAV